MPAYHSELQVEGPEACGCALLPLRTSKRGPARAAADGEKDILDEVLYYYRANVLFRNFEIKSPADRTLIYMTLYVSMALRESLRLKTPGDTKRQLQIVALHNFALPGESGWALGTLFPAPADRSEADAFKAYFRQAREEMGERLVEVLYAGEVKNKWWAMFSKRKFMGIEMRER